MLCLNFKKLTNYRDFELEVQIFLDLRTLKNVPVVIGELVTVCGNLQEILSTISPRLKLSLVHKSALLGTYCTLCIFINPHDQDGFT